MASIRLKLTLAYAGALVATMAVFGVALWQARKANVQREQVALLRERQRNLFMRTDLAQGVLRRSASGGMSLLVTRDTLVGPMLRPDIAVELDIIPDYLIILDSTGRSVYVSPAGRALGAEDADLLVRAAQQLTPEQLGAVVQLQRGEVLIAGRLQNPPGVLPVARIVAGTPMGQMKRQSERELLGTMLVVAPFLILFSMGGAFLIAGRAFTPIDRLITELEAITDGRSLPRRLAVEASGDELARLTQTLNAMIGRLENYFGALRRFTADASHELKTPLAVLRADVERAMHANTTTRERMVALEEALQETTRMADLVEQLLTLARADEGRFDLFREPLHLEPLVRDVFETAVILGESVGLEVTMPVIEDAVVLGDRPRLRQLFLNLVTNAIKYTPRGGSVELALRRAGETATLTVRDTGIGIAAADLPYIFERFWRADRVRSRAAERGGFGLGLAISQWIAQAHGGTLTAMSRLTRGSTFTVTLPIATEREAAGEFPMIEPGSYRSAFAQPLSNG